MNKKKAFIHLFRCKKYWSVLNNFLQKRTYLSFRHYGKTIFLLVTVPKKLEFLITCLPLSQPPPPLDIGSVLPQFQLKTSHTLTDILFDDVTILGIIRSINPIKSSGFQLVYFNLDFLFHVFSRTTVVCVDLSVVIGGPIHLSPRITYQVF